MTKQSTCPVCGGNSHYLDTLDGNRSCEEQRGLVLPEAGWTSDYFLCPDCGFCFAPDLQSWSEAEFKERIYNADYTRVDPDCLEVRPQANARMLQQAFGALSGVDHLDYGGGEGRLSQLLAQSGWSSISFDPFYGNTAALSNTPRFALVTAFEVFEHAPEPRSLVRQLTSYLSRPGLIVFSTLLSDGNLAAGKKLDWWYAAPRNGHISLYSRESLARLAHENGLSFTSFSADLHAFWNELPVWSNQLIGQPGQRVAEEVALRSRVQNCPSDHAAWHALGLHAFNAGNLAFSVQCIEAAIAIDSKVAIYHRNIGEMYRRVGQLERSVLAGRKAVKLVPADLDAHYNLGLSYTDGKDYPKAIACYRKALKLNPLHNLSWNNLGSALEQQGNKGEALAAYEKAIAIDPRHAEAQNNAGAVYSEQGKLDAAQAAFAAAILAKPDFVEAHYNLSSLKKYAKDDPHLAMLESVYARRQLLSDRARIRYCFALGKALDDCGDYDRAFAAYEEGNRLQHALLPVDEARADTLLQQIMTAFDKGFFAGRLNWKGAVDAQRTPIFIVGMPRSGTTLLEQILCSHASVFGAGELVDLNETIGKASGVTLGNPFTNRVTVLSETELKRLGEDYLSRVWKLSPESRYITDKMPANFFYLGLIHLALPHAKIIHAMRDPMDSCFSCYSRLFNDTMEFAYDQDSLGRYYTRYMTLMAHWHRVLPEGTILDTPYELMVSDTEAQARRVLEFVGLPWDENCLKFHENKRLVKTASVAQVRKPIYTSSVARWKRFARHLKPLYDLVKDYRTSDDAEDLFAGATVTVAGAAGEQLAKHETAESAHISGISLYRQGQFDEALAHFDRALLLQPNFPSALNGKGFLLQDLDRIEEALACFARSVELAPEFSMARLNLGMAQLKLGDWQNGWENYEARWTGSAEAGNGSFTRPACPLPQWNGEAYAGDISGKRLLVITEQGFGDTFQFARYLPLAAKRFAKVGFVCSQPTMRLMEWAFGDSIVTFTRMPADFDAWDLQCPLMSLPRAFCTRPATIPAEVPYLRVPEKATAHWRERLDLAAPGSLRIGIAWAGRKAHQYDTRRSLSFTQILPLLNDERVTWVSLQKWAPEDQRPSIPENVDWLDWTEEFVDFADTAALIANLDLVISIDSAMVHLAGALRRPVWMFNRFDTEWRWFRGRSDSPWYPSLRIFNQPAFGDWGSVLNDVQCALGDLPGRRTVPRVTRAKPKSPALIDGAMPQVDGLTVDQAMQLASQHQSAGRLAMAARILRQILSAHPRNAHAIHLLGVVAHQAGKPELAVQLIEQAVAIDGQVALFHSNLAEMLRQQGRIDEAIRHGEQAVALDASLASAYSNLGIAYCDAKQYERSEASHQKALALAPQIPQSINNLGSIARARKDLKGAADWYRKALALNGDYLESLSNLGAVLVEDDLADDAVSYLVRALQLQPNYPEALCNLGLVRFKQENITESIALFRRSLALRTDYPEALIGLARALHEIDQVDEARRLVERATEVAPDKADSWCQLGTLAMEMGDTSDAEAAFQRALAIDPDMTDAVTGLGNLCLEAGKIDESIRLFEQSIETKTDNLGARFHLSQARKVRPGDANLAALEAMQHEAGEWNEEKRTSYHYALGKSYDDLKEYDKAFPHFLEGARLKRKKLHYDADADAARIHRITEIVDGDFLARLKGAGDPSHVPVFVLGMPRSGTTLTEQIIASHPDVFGAGELRDLMEVVQGHGTSTAFQPYPENLPILTPDTLTAWGKDYVARLSRRAPGAKRITDKMPANYLALGLIPLLLPNARIVHVKRNPVDTCVSCFTRLFNKHQDATYDLYELGRHYASYGRLMNHWRKVLPASAFLEVQYEDIVANMESEARRLIAYVGLEWDDACLSFHKTERNIRTASVTQVRQPIYSSSVERWRHYEKYLGPLLEGLGEFSPIS